MNNKKENDFDFASKTQKIAKVKFPDSTENRFIVPTNKDGIGFQWKKYDERMKIDRETFDNTILGATKICRNLYREKQKEEHKDFTASFQSYLIVAVLLIILSFLFLLILIHGSRDMGLLYTAVTIIALGCAFIFIVVIKIWTLNPQFMNLDKMTQQKMEEYFTQQNASYSSKGYKWVLEENLYWVELQTI